MAVLGVDIGGTWVRVGISEKPPEFLLQRKVPLSTLGIPLPMEKFIALVADFCHKGQALGMSIEAIGVSVAAVVEASTGYIRRGENLAWKEVPLGRLLRMRFQVPVFVDTDVFCGAWAEYQVGCAQGIENFLYVAVGTGIGHALVLNGKIWRGQHNSASVFGHIKVVPDGKGCYCGQKGCLCQYSSGRAIASRRAKGNLSEVEEGLEKLALAVSHVYNLLDIECVVLSGGALSYFDFGLERIVAFLEENVYPEIRPIVVKKGQLGENSQLVGAVIQATDLSKKFVDR